MAIGYNITIPIRQMFDSNILPDYLLPPPMAGLPSPVAPEPGVGPHLSLNRPEKVSAVTDSTLAR